MDKLANSSDSDFYSSFRGSFVGILKWPQLEEFWEVLRSRADNNWYIYALGEPVPENPVTKDRLNTFITEIDALLRKEHQEDYCGVVYVDDKDEPSLVKIYDPGNLGIVCGYSDNPPLPGWIVTRLKPEPLDKNTFLVPSRKRWWQGLFK
ncbi:MAG: hypothetical protein PVG75_04945 [Thioalkalispiraceae bacterium]|jgi:hypothetical protein